MTSGGHRRAEIAMTPAERETFLSGRHHATMCTLGPDGSIHAVAMWYALVDGHVCVQTKAKSQKVQNLRRDPRMTCLVEAGERYEELRGVELVGEAEISDDPDLLWRVGTGVYERYVAPITEGVRAAVEEMLRKRVTVVFHETRSASWDHRKL